MTSTMQMIRTPTDSISMQDEWSKLFPNFTTLTGSRQFMKKLTAISLSTITFMRGIFPDKAYGERNLCGLKVKILTEGTNMNNVNKFINLIKSCYDAIEKKYLYQLSIGICTDAGNKDTVLEAYHLNFRYKEDEFSITKNSSSIKLNEENPTVEATILLLKSIFQISDILSPLPSNAFLTMKLLYNDEITPKDYEPPGFEPSENEKFLFPPNSVKFELGKISTDLHGYKMYVKTALSKEPLSQMLEESVLTDSQRSRENIQHMQHMEENTVPQTEFETKSDIIEDSVPVNDALEEIYCPCTCRKDSGTDILECSICGEKQHAICYGFFKPQEKEFQFYCIQCISEDPIRNRQQDLIYTYEGKEQQELCALRRALVFCKSVKYITATQLEKGLECGKELAKDLIERLEFERFIRKSGQKYIVNENKITNNGYREYFPSYKNETIKNLQSKKLLKLYEVPDDDDDDDATKRKRKRNFKRNKQFSEDNAMDFHIDQVENLTIEDSFETQATRKSKRLSQPKIVNDDSENLSQPLKRRCKNVRSPITFK